MTGRPEMSKRDPGATRARILQHAFQEIYAEGFRGASLDRILDAAGVTKGAFYHHFSSKAALGHAVITEVLGEMMERFAARLGQPEDPISAIQAFIQRMPRDAHKLGCPINNLAQEMSPLDLEFRRRIEHLFQRWADTVATCLRDGQQRSLVRADIDPEEVALFTLAAWEGAIGLAKTAQSPAVFRHATRPLRAYLDSLRP
jgi:AcrR family transcriptional regulator